MKKRTCFSRTLVLALLLPVSDAAMAQKYKIDTLQYKGDINKYINVVILGDGYTSTEMNKLQTDAGTYMADFMFSQTPYKEYKNYFNVFLIEVPSPESGIKHPRTASDCPAVATFPAANPDNFFGTSFDIAGIHRLVTPEAAKVSNVLAANFPNYDQAYMIANSSQYGGAGGQFATFTTNASSGEIGLHEGGHSFGGLADEYWAGPQYAAEKPNMTKQTNPALVKWKNWMNVNGIGINPHTGDASWKKPRNGECKMEVLGKPFCSVCTETIVEKIHSLVRPVYAQDPVQTNVSVTSQSINFSVSYMLPISNTMSTRWILDGVASAANQVSVIKWTNTGTLLAQDKSGIVLNNSMLTAGSHKLKLYALDTTHLTRSDTHPQGHLDSIVWTLNVSPMGIEQVAAGNTADVKLFPNPVTDNLAITYKLEKAQTVVVNLLTIDGKRLQTYTYKEAGQGAQARNIDLKRFDAGIYLVELKSDAFHLIQKIIKQ